MGILYNKIGYLTTKPMIKCGKIIIVKRSTV
jgi:hypothetical protein